MRLTDLLFEAMPLSLAKPFVQIGKTTLYDDVFARFAKYRRKDGGDRLYLPLVKSSSNHDPMNFVVADDIIRKLRDQSSNLRYFSTSTEYPVPDGLYKSINGLRFSTEDSEQCSLYTKGLVQNDRGIQRIGKLLQSLIVFYKKLIRDFYHYPADSWGFPHAKRMIDDMLDEVMSLQRSSSEEVARFSGQRMGDGGYYAVVSRHPYDIAGMSTGRGWTSCTDLIDGSEKKYVECYVRNNHLIAYLIREGDWNIEHPIARANIIRYERLGDDEKIDSNDYVLKVADLYGMQSNKLFNRTVERFCSAVNRGRDDGLYFPHHTDQYSLGVQKQRNLLRSASQRARPRYRGGA